MNTSATTEERLWAVLSHLSSLAFGMGILLPIIGWSDQRRKSNYSSFQSLQALGYQSLGFTVWILSYLVIILLTTILLLITLRPEVESGQNENVILNPGMIFFSLLFLVFSPFTFFCQLLPPSLVHLAK